VGALGAVAIPDDRYNAFSREVFAIKATHLSATELTDSEFKAQDCFAKSAFKRQSIHGDSYWLAATSEFFDALKKYDARVFVIWTTNPSLLTLRNPTSTALSKPYKQLLFDMRAYMRAEHRRLARLKQRCALGGLSFDHRGYREDEATARAVSNFLIRTSGKTSNRWDRFFLTIPSFTASSISPGLQAADLVSYLGAHRADPAARPELAHYQARLNGLSYQYMRGTRKTKTIRKVN